MRFPILAALLIAGLSIASPGLAQVPSVNDGRKWEPAPTGGPISDPVAPVDRAGGRGVNAGPANSTPFSGPPTDRSGGQTSPATRDTTGSTEAGTPALGR